MCEVFAPLFFARKEVKPLGYVRVATLSGACRFYLMHGVSIHRSIESVADEKPQCSSTLWIFYSKMRGRLLGLGTNWKSLELFTSC